MSKWTPKKQFKDGGYFIEELVENNKQTQQILLTPVFVKNHFDQTFWRFAVQKGLGEGTSTFIQVEDNDKIKGKGQLDDGWQICSLKYRKFNDKGYETKEGFFMDKLLVQRNQLTYVWTHHGFMLILMKNL